jgi:hypothetical protein
MKPVTPLSVSAEQLFQHSDRVTNVVRIDDLLAERHNGCELSGAA